MRRRWPGWTRSSPALAVPRRRRTPGNRPAPDRPQPRRTVRRRFTARSSPEHPPAGRQPGPAALAAGYRGCGRAVVRVVAGNSGAGQRDGAEIVDTAAATGSGQVERYLAAGQVRGSAGVVVEGAAVTAGPVGLGLGVGDGENGRAVMVEHRTAVLGLVLREARLRDVRGLRVGPDGTALAQQRRVGGEVALADGQR